MVTLSTSIERRAGVSYVTATIDNRIDRPVADVHTVSLRAAVDPVWPPEGAEQPDWTNGTTTVEVPVGAVRGVGFATPAEPTDDPVTVVDVRPGPADSTDTSPSPRTVLQALGDPRPPREAVPTPDDGQETVTACVAESDREPSVRGTEANDNGGVVDETNDEACDDELLAVASCDAVQGETPKTEQLTSDLGTDRSKAPAPVEAWLARVDARVGDPQAAARAADRAHLRRVGRKVDELLDRLEGRR